MPISININKSTPRQSRVKLQNIKGTRKKYYLPKEKKKKKRLSADTSLAIIGALKIIELHVQDVKRTVKLEFSAQLSYHKK